MALVFEQALDAHARVVRGRACTSWAATRSCCARASCSWRAASRRATPRSCCRGWSTRSACGPGRTSCVEELAEHASVPVINMLTRDHHPCQALADLLTLRERFGRLEGLKLAYVGDGNNVARSLLVAGAHRGRGGGDAPRRPSCRCRRRRASSPEPRRSRGAHALYTDVWVSMGDEADAERSAASCSRRTGSTRRCSRRRATTRSCSTACPAHPGEEITEDVLYGERSAVWDQAENRLHAQKALARASTLRAMTKLIALILACLALGLAALRRRRRQRRAARQRAASSTGAVRGERRRSGGGGTQRRR